MTRDPIGQLLSEADAQTRTPAVDANDLAQRVIDRVRTRRIVRAATPLVAVAVVGIVVLTHRPSEVRRPVESVATNVDLNSVRQQIEFQQRLVDRMLQREQRRHNEAQLISISIPVDDPPVERAAARLISEANRLLESSGQQQAIKAYSQVIDSFPDTISAELARKRLAELKKEG
jgi:hypothetical protein